MERLLDYFVPEKYFLDLDIDKYAKTIGGVVTIEGTPKAETIKFHSVGLTIDSVEVDGKPVEFTTKKETIEVHLSIIPQNAIKVNICYHGTLNENMEGAYLSYYEYEGKKETIVTTQFESHYARQAFPCIDEPAAKAVFELSITLPNEDIVLSNMPELKHSSGPRRSRPSPRGSRAISRAAALRNTPNHTLTSGFKTTTFLPTPKMSTYLLAWVIGKFHGKTITNKNGVEITTYCALNQDKNSVDFANNIAAKSLEFYDENFGVKYPLTKLDQIALPDFEAGAMENWGLVTYRESMLLAGKTATLSTKKGVALTVAHELSHQWFGNLVTMEWWDDLWLNESFATVMEYYAVDSIHPEYKIFEGFFTRDSYAALTRDAYKDVQSVHQDVEDPAEIATLFDSAIVYAKGARLMLMLIRLMGWENFCQGIKDYFKKHQYGNTKGDDLWTALRPYADFDPKKLMHAFIDQPGYPVVSSKNNFKTYTQKRFLLDAPMPDSDWPLPKITEDMSGHYILNLTNAEFEKRLANFDKLSLEEKLRLLIDRGFLTKTELASPASLVPLLQKFQNEDSAAVWNIMASLISNLKIFVDDDSAEEKVLKKFILELITPKLKELGLTTKKSDDENTIRLRAILMGLDYYAENQENLQKLSQMYDQDYTTLDPEIRDDILSAAVYCNPNLVDEFIVAYQKTADPDIKYDLLSAITLTKDDAAIKKVANLLERPDIIKPQDQLYLFIDLYRNHKSKAAAFDWMVKNWQKIKDQGGDKSISDYPMLLGRLARTDEELKNYQDFFTPKKSDPALSRAIKIGENEIKARIKLIKKDQQEVFRALGI